MCRSYREYGCDAQAHTMAKTARAYTAKYGIELMQSHRASVCVLHVMLNSRQNGNCSGGGNRCRKQK
jgi:hypothetical protein